jgi:hypothetical protein
MNLEEVKQFLEENKEDKKVSAYIEELSTVSAEKVEGFLDTKEGKRILQPRLDTNFTKGLNTWKDKNLDKLVDEEVRKKNPDKTPEQKELEQLRNEIESERKQRNRETLKNKALTIADEKKLPKGILDYFIGEDEDTTNANLTKLEEEYNRAVQGAVDSKFKESGTKFEQGKPEGSTGQIDIASLAAQTNITNK